MFDNFLSHFGHKEIAVEGNEVNLKDMSNTDLLEEYTYAVKRWHYDPVSSREPLFTLDELTEEMKRRLQNKEENKTEDWD